MPSPQPTRSMAKIATLGGAFILICLVGFIGFRYAKPYLQKKLKMPLAVSKVNANPESALFPYQNLGTTADDSAAATEDKIPGRQFTVEVVVKETKEQAEAIVRQLSQEGLSAYYTPYNNKGHVYFRVRVGVFASPTQAETTLATTQKIVAKARITKL